MTVRADIVGRYSNRMYAYEPADIKLCKCSLRPASWACFCPWNPDWFLVNVPSSPPVKSNMEKAKKLLKSELWAGRGHVRSLPSTSGTRSTGKVPFWFLLLILLLYIQNAFRINVELFIHTRWRVCGFICRQIAKDYKTTHEYYTGHLELLSCC